MHTPDRAVSRSVTRRVLMAASLSAVVTGIAGHAPVQSASTSTWKPWLLSASDALRPAPPASVSTADLSEVVASQRQATASSLATIERWDDPTSSCPGRPSPSTLSGPPAEPGAGRPRAGATARGALRYARGHRGCPHGLSPARALADHAVTPSAGATDPPASPPRTLPWPRRRQPSWPTSSRMSRPRACRRWPPRRHLPTRAGTRLPQRPRGRAGHRDARSARGPSPGERPMARDEAWDGAGRLTGEGSWQPTPPGYFQQPTEPACRHLAPLDPGQRRSISPARRRRPTARRPGQAELAGVQEAVARRTPEQAQAVRFWAGGPGTVTPAGLWTAIARDLIVRDGLDALHAARVLALTTVAMADGFICCWDAKYTYWTERPITADPSLDVLIPTPPFPSYTSGHSTISTAAATVLGHLFPADEADLAGAGGGSAELASLGGHPLPDRQRDGRARRRHDRPPGRGPRPERGGGRLDACMHDHGREVIHRGASPAQRVATSLHRRRTPVSHEPAVAPPRRSAVAPPCARESPPAPPA